MVDFLHRLPNRTSRNVLEKPYKADTPTVSFFALYSELRLALRNTLVIIVAVAYIRNFAIHQREGDLNGDDVDDDVPD